MDFWKSLIILKEIEKPTGKYLRFSAKTQLKLEIFEKRFKFTYKTSMESWFLTYFLSHLPWLLSFYTHLEHTKFFGVGLGVVPPGLVELVGWINPLYSHVVFIHICTFTCRYGNRILEILHYFGWSIKVYKLFNFSLVITNKTMRKLYKTCCCPPA